MKYGIGTVIIKQMLLVMDLSVVLVCGHMASAGICRTVWYKQNA
jgi:hypothetical protein